MTFSLEVWDNVFFELESESVRLLSSRKNDRVSSISSGYMSFQLRPQHVHDASSNFYSLLRNSI